jgi:hypothetical protein
MSESFDLARMVRAARDEGAAVDGLVACVERLQRARQAQAALAVLPADQLRAALASARTELGGEQR